MSWNQWHSSQSSWPNWCQDSSSHGGWQAPTTPPRKPKQPGTPRKRPVYQEIFGVNFPRKIQPSTWATQHGLAGRNLEDIKLHELSWQGWQNYNLRALAQGRYVSINCIRSIREATFVSLFLQHLREQKLELDQAVLTQGFKCPRTPLSTPKRPSE